MGIVNLDSITSSFGTSFANTYVSLNNGHVNISCERSGPNNDACGWVLSASFSVWVSKEFRLSNKSIIDRVNVRASLTDDMLNKDCFTLAYDLLKLQLTNTDDSI